MRLWLLTCCLALGVGCAGPHSTGALWAQQNLEQEGALFRLSDEQRADGARAYEIGLADESLKSERARLADELQVCPGPSQPLSVSMGDRVRDTIRLRVLGDPSRGAMVAQLALADWRLRRARATGNSQFCDSAQATLAGDPSQTQPPAGETLVLSSLPMATVSRGQHQTATPLASAEPASVVLSQYALGYVDAVRAAAPLPQYLALVYGGYVLDVRLASSTVASDESAVDLVDRYASAYPEWEPDALYAALRSVPP
jgi:hypothetical protein